MKSEKGEISERRKSAGVGKKRKRYGRIKKTGMRKKVIPQYKKGKSPSDSPTQGRN